MPADNTNGTNTETGPYAVEAGSDLSDTVPASPEIVAVLDELAVRLDGSRFHGIGFPGATDLDYSPLAGLLTRPINNVGDPWIDGAHAAHTKNLEREVIDQVARLLRAPADDRWGYVTTGGSEGNLYALRLARDIYSDATVYLSDAAHYSVDKAIDILGLRSVRIRAGDCGEIDYTDLAVQVQRRRDRPVIVVATAGTTMTEAVDDVRRIGSILDELVVRRRFVHVDAALAGLPLALLNPLDRPGLDFDDGADSISISAHKFLAAPTPCGVILVRASHRHRVTQTVGYTASPDATIGGSRSGHAALMWWYALRTLGIDGMRRRAEHARELAALLHSRLQELGWPSLRNPHAMTVVLRTPPSAVTDRWVLASDRGWSHVITVPGVTRTTVDAFFADLEAAVTTELAPSLAAANGRSAIGSNDIDSEVEQGSAAPLVAVPGQADAPTPAPESAVA